jgi:hypothetical protein
MYFSLTDRNSSYLFSQSLTNGNRIDSFLIDGNGNPWFFRVPSTSATFSNLQWDTNSGKIWIRASDSSIKENVQDNPYPTEFCYKLTPKIWTDKETGQPGIGFMAQDVENLLKQYDIPTWLTPTDQYGNKIILYEAIRDLCYQVTIENHEKLVETQAKLDLVIQLVCPIGKIDPICAQLNSGTDPV